MELDAKFYSTLGASYEDAFAHDPGLLKFVQRAMEHLPPKANILDVGCGTGRPVAATLVAAGHSITGIDISDVMIELSRKAVPAGRFEVMDMRLFEPPEGTLFGAVFNILSLFALNRGEIEQMVTRWSQWLSVGGIVCICTFAAEDCQPESRGQGYDEDGSCARDIGFRFMGHDIRITLLTRVGWEKLLRASGFEILETTTELFIPPKSSDSEGEWQYFIIAKKIQ